MLDTAELHVKSVRELREAIPAVLQDATSDPLTSARGRQSNSFDEQSQKPEKAIGGLRKTCRYARSGIAARRNASEFKRTNEGHTCIPTQPPGMAIRAIA
ncbi:hypothetical protein [Variovorax sp. NFACC29]|uniref:hypothetical protein n=1 Tax=Variovorax sp. NFACC29 TaxID=1566272 RepID=UPI001160ACE8